MVNQWRLKLSITPKTVRRLHGQCTFNVRQKFRVKSNLPHGRVAGPTNVRHNAQYKGTYKLLPKYNFQSSYVSLHFGHRDRFGGSAVLIDGVSRQRVGTPVYAGRSPGGSSSCCHDGRASFDGQSYGSYLLRTVFR